MFPIYRPLLFPMYAYTFPSVFSPYLSLRLCTFPVSHIRFPLTFSHKRFPSAFPSTCPSTSLYVSLYVSPYTFPSVFLSTCPSTPLHFSLYGSPILFPLLFSPYVSLCCSLHLSIYFSALLPRRFPCIFSSTFPPYTFPSVVLPTCPSAPLYFSIYVSLYFFPIYVSLCFSLYLSLSTPLYFSSLILSPLPFSPYSAVMEDCVTSVKITRAVIRKKSWCYAPVCNTGAPYNVKVWVGWGRCLVTNTPARSPKTPTHPASQSTPRYFMLLKF